MDRKELRLIFISLTSKLVKGLQLSQVCYQSEADGFVDGDLVTVALLLSA